MADEPDTESRHNGAKAGELPLGARTGASPAGAPAAFHLLAKPTGSVCNLDCAYCFFLEKEKLYPGARSRMSDELLARYLRQLIEGHRTPEVTIAWQGGEPMLMGLEFFRRAVELAQELARPGMTVAHTIQTNGTKINGDWARFFAENGFLVGLSIDGPRRLHDAYRRDKAGKPTFDRVLRGLAALREHGVEWNALTTVHAANAEHPLEVYRFLRDECECRFVQFIPIVERPTANGVPCGSAVTDRSVKAGQWGSFLAGVFDEWVGRDVGETFVQMFDVALANWYGEPAGLCVHSATCGSALAMEWNGDVYACDHFVEPGYLRGNIAERPLTELVDSPEQRRFGQDKLDTLPQLLPRVRRALRLPRRLPQGPLHRDPRRRARPQLPLRRLQGLLPPRRRAPAAHVRAAARRPRARGDHGGVPRARLVASSRPAPTSATARS